MTLQKSHLVQGTHTGMSLEARLGSYSTGPVALAERLLRLLKPCMCASQSSRAAVHAIPAVTLCCVVSLEHAWSCLWRRCFAFMSG